MQRRIIRVGFAGMNQDVVNFQVNSKQAYEILNLRLNSGKSGNAMELTSEQGTKKIQFKIGNSQPQDYIVESGEVIVGCCVINEYLVLFTRVGTERPTNKIYRLQLIGSSYFKVVKLYEGSLGIESPEIDTIASYENENVQKVYWIDGVNQPRVINVAGQDSEAESRYMDGNNYLDDPFSFTPAVSSEDTSIVVEKMYSGGLFHAGTVQYAISYYNDNAQETSIVYVTPLNYVAHEDRGEQSEKRVGCSFKVTLHVPDDSVAQFDNIRVYQIVHTSVDTTPQVKVVMDIDMDSMTHVENTTDNTYQFIDSNEQGFVFDAYSIVIQKQLVYPNTFEHKDQRLFVGNYSTQDNIEQTNLVEALSESGVEWLSNTDIKMIRGDQVSYDQLYVYSNQMSKGNSMDIKTFKGSEWYKLGLQFKDKYGIWSDPYPIGTFYNSTRPNIVSDEYGIKIRLPYAKFDGLSASDIKDMLSNEEQGKYVCLRPVVSFPTKSERNVLCQGVLNPTIFNLKERIDNTCYAQASWFFRPWPNSIDSLDGQNRKVDNSDVPYEGRSFIEARHMRPLYGSDSQGGEIQSMYFDDSYGFGLRKKKQATEIANPKPYESFYYVDQNILTLNSPEIDFDEQTWLSDMTSHKLRIVGDVRFTNSSGKYNIIAGHPLFLNNEDVSSPGSHFPEMTRGDTLANGFYNHAYSNYAPSYEFGGTTLSTINCWQDDICNILTWDNKVRLNWNTNRLNRSYFVYPWQRHHLNNYNSNQFDKSDLDNGASDYIGITNEQESSNILHKILANTKVGYTVYSQASYAVNTDDLKLYRSEEVQPIKIGNGKLYYGNIDSIVSCTSDFLCKNIENYFFDEQSTYHRIAYDWKTKKGYPIIINDYSDEDNFDTNHNPVPMNSKTTAGSEAIQNGDPNWNSDTMWPIRGDMTPNIVSQDPILIRYKSTPHIVVKLQGGQICPFPDIYNDDTKIRFDSNEEQYLWDGDIYTNDQPGLSVQQDQMTGNKNQYLGRLWIGEVYRFAEDERQYNPYCDDSNMDILKNRIWVPCGNEVDIDSTDTNAIKWLEGDTFFQRYDCLKTYPLSNDDYQSVIEIASFMVETHVNLDGRYDTNRGLYDNTYITNTNFNLINPVYSQTNNFFNYQVQTQKNSVNRFPNTVLWSLNKQNGAEIDNWTKILTSSSMDLDGDKGSLQRLIRWMNNIFAIQNRGISRIRYNDNVALTTKSGAPVEISNSNEVGGKEYITELYGTHDKHCVAVGMDGIYFYDRNNPGIYHVGSDQYGQTHVNNLSANTMQTWVDTHNISRVQYDNISGDVMFSYGQKMLAFNGGIFSSMYDYTGWITQFGSHSLNILPSYNNEGNAWFMRESDQYNQFYGQAKDYGVTFIASPSAQDGGKTGDCIFDTFEYIGDVYKSQYNTLIEDTSNTNTPFHSTPDNTWYTSFNTITCSNSYQQSQSSPESSGINPMFKKKFRTWRVQIPRQGLQGYAKSRMRDNWMKISLKYAQPTNPMYNKFVMKDAFVSAFF